MQQLTGFFDEVASPLLSDVSVTYSTNDTAFVVDSVSRSTFATLYKGSELVVAGAIVDKQLKNTAVALTALITARSCGCNVAWSRRFVVDTNALVRVSRLPRRVVG